MPDRVGCKKSYGLVWCIVLLMVFMVVTKVHAAQGVGELLALGQEALLGQKFAQASQTFAQILANRSVSAGERFTALEGRCTALFKQSLVANQVDLARQAVADCSEAIRLNAKKGSVWRLRGLARLVTGQAEKALINFNRALQLEPGDAVSLRNRGIAYLGLGRLAEADVDFNAALRLDTDQAWNRFNRGLLLGRSGQIPEAKADLREFVQLRGAKAIEVLALLLQDKQEKSGVRVAAEAVLQENVLAMATAVPKEEEKLEPVAVQSAPVAVTPVAPSISSPGKEYLFRVGSYQDQDNAAQIKRSIESMGLPMFEEEIKVDGRHFYRIWVGPFDEAAKAQAAFEKVSRLPGQFPEAVHLR